MDLTLTARGTGSSGRSIATARWTALACLSFVAFAALAVAVARHFAIPFDQTLLSTARSWSQLHAFWTFLSDSANIPLIVIGVGIVLWLLVRRRRREAILVAVVLAAATAGSEAVKQLVARPRPLGTDPTIPGVVYSFPSGHTLEAATIYGIIAILIWRSRLPAPARLGVAVVLSVLVVLVGIARVALAEHYPSDVLAGLLAGIGDLAIFAVLTAGQAAHDSRQGNVSVRSTSPRV